jgi:hypothetical protein
MVIGPVETVRVFTKYLAEARRFHAGVRVFLDFGFANAAKSTQAA